MAGNETLYKSPRAYLPLMWARNNVPLSLDVVMESAGLPSGLDELPMPRAGSVTAIAVVMSEAITDGSIAVSLRKNGVNLSSSVSVGVGDGTTKVGDLAPGAAEFEAGDVIGLRLVSSSNLAPNAQIDLAVYLETQNV